MLPLSCVNCCHNPLQLGPTGTAFGYCTRHRVVLQSPELLTCGQLRRKDLYGASVEREQEAHSSRYVRSRPALLHAPKDRKKADLHYERSNGGMPSDRVVEEVLAYGTMPKIATMAALRQIPGTRAEIALTSLGRAYIANCAAKHGAWTSGLHLVWWTLGRLSTAPVIRATDLRTTFGQRIERLTSVAQWLVIGHRLTLVAEVARQSREENDPLADLETLPEEAAMHGDPDQPDETLRFLASKPVQKRIDVALSEARYHALGRAARS